MQILFKNHISTQYIIRIQHKKCTIVLIFQEYILWDRLAVLVS